MQSSDPGDSRALAKRLSRRHWLAGVHDNPLARAADRRQAGIRHLCILLWILALPVAVGVGAMVAVSGVQAATAQAHDRVPTSAVLTADAPKVTVTSNGTPVMVSSEVAARWTAADNSPRTGVVEANPGALTGMVIPIWVDGAGRPVSAPVSAGAAIAMGLAIAVGIWLGAGVLVLALGKSSSSALDRRRRLEWDRDWERVAPIWLSQ